MLCSLSEVDRGRPVENNPMASYRAADSAHDGICKPRPEEFMDANEKRQAGEIAQRAAEFTDHNPVLYVRRSSRNALCAPSKTRKRFIEEWENEGPPN